MQPVHFVKDGQGPIVVLSHALGCDLTMWDGVVAALAKQYTVLRYDHRGHGRSAAADNTYNINDLADDAAELIRAAVGRPVHFVGLSLGGRGGHAIAARHPQLLHSLTIANSASHYDDTAQAIWQARIDTVLAKGVASIVEGAMQRWFTPEFRDPTHPESAQVEAMRAVLECTQQVPYAHACAAVKTIDLDASNKRISCATLVIAGSRDEATPPFMSRAIALNIPQSRLKSLDAAHLSAVEQPKEFARLLTDFWNSL